MTKVLYNGEEIELVDELEKGELELDLLTEEDLEDTIEFIPNNYHDNTKEYDALADTIEVKDGFNGEE